MVRRTLFISSLLLCPTSAGVLSPAMRRGAFVGIASLVLLAGCAPLVDAAVPETVRDLAHTAGEEGVREDIEELALSPEIRHVLAQLAHDLVDAAAGAATDEEVQNALRAILRTAIAEIRTAAGDIDLDPVLTRAEQMVHDVVADAIQQIRGSLRGAIDGPAIERWVRALLHHVMNDVLDLIAERVGDDSAERSGRWLRTAFRELVRDVDVETETEHIARAAARGAGNGIGDALDDGLGRALDAASERLSGRIATAMQDAAGPWREVAQILMVVAGLFVFGTGLFAFLLYRTRTTLHRTQQDHDRTIMELQHGARQRRSADEVLGAVRDRNVTLHKENDPPLPPRP